MIETGLHRTEEVAAYDEQALIGEARILHKRRQRRLIFRLIAAALLIGIAASVITLSVSRSQPKTSRAPNASGLTKPVKDMAYVTTSEGILKINLATGKVVGRITPHGSALALDPIAIAPDGNTAYVVSDNVLTPIDLASGLAKAPISLGSPTGGIADATGYPSSIAIAPDGRTAYVAVPGKGTIVPVHLASRSNASPIFLGGTPQSIAIAPNGATAYVTNTTTDAVDVVNLVTGSVNSIAGIVDPLEVAITPNGARAYVSTGTGIVPIDLPSGSVFAQIRVGSMRAGFVPGPIVVSQDGQRIYVANTESAIDNATVFVASTRSNTIIHSLGGFAQPVGLSLAGDGHTLYVLNVAASPGAAIGGGSGTSSAVQKNALVPIDLNSGVVHRPILLPAAPRSFGLGRS